MKVVTWNIRFGLDVRGAVTALRDDVDLRDADVVLLQEMDEAGAAAIAAALDRRYVYTRASVHRDTGRDFGNAILAAGPIDPIGPIGLPHTARWRGEPRTATTAIVHVDGVRVVVASVHTEIVTLSLRKRVEQFRHLAAGIGSPVRAVVGGDFNTATRRATANLAATMASAGLQRATVAAPPTFRRFGRDMALDHVFTTGFAVVGTGVVTTSASDHRPLWVELRPDE